MSIEASVQFFCKALDLQGFSILFNDNRIYGGSEMTSIEPVGVFVGIPFNEMSARVCFFKRCAFRHCRAAGCSADDSCSAVFNSCSAVPAKFRWRSHALCGSGRTDTRNVRRKALQHRYSVLCAGFQCDDGAGCGVRIKISALSQNISPNGVKKANRIRKQAAKSI